MGVRRGYERLAVLHDQIHGGTSRASPSKRDWIPKGEGKLRTIGFAALEDKIVQQALVDLLQTIGGGTPQGR